MIENLNKARCRILLSQNYIGHLSYISNNRPFVVPITYYYDKTSNAILGYSGKGHKIRALRINRDVSMEVSEVDSVSQWKSVMVQGHYREFEGSTAKIYLHKFAEGVKGLILRKEGKDLNFISEFSSKAFKEGLPIVFKIDIEEITGKERSD